MLIYNLSNKNYKCCKKKLRIVQIVEVILLKLSFLLKNPIIIKK